MQMRSLAGAFVGTVLSQQSARGYHTPQPGQRPFLTSGRVASRPQAIRKLVTCKLNYHQAQALAEEALLNQPLSQRDTLMGEVQTPNDIYLSGLATARLLSKINANASDEMIKQNHLNALFLRDEIGQRVVNHALKTWQDRLHCLGRVIQSLPREIGQLVKPAKKPKPDETLAPFSKEDALQLANLCLREQPVGHRLDLLKKIRTFDDVVMLDREASRLLKRLNQGQPQEIVRENTLNYLFLMHHTGVHITNLFIETPQDKRLYWQHLWKTLKP